MGMVPKTTKSEVKLYKSVGVTKFFGFLATLLISFNLSTYLLDSKLLRILFVIFCSLVFVVCCLPSPTDPSKNFFKGLLDYLRFLIHKKEIYSENSDEYKNYKKECEERERAKAAKKAKLEKLRKKKKAR